MWNLLHLHPSGQKKAWSLCAAAADALVEAAVAVAVEADEDDVAAASEIGSEAVGIAGQ